MSFCGICKKPSSRLIKEATCGHEKCRTCFIAEENGCFECGRESTTKESESKNYEIENENKSSKKPVHIRKVSETCYSCTFCNKTFARNSQYYHYYCDKTISKPFKCTSCPKTFRSSAHLKYHSEEHSASLFNCDVCSKKFTKKAILMKHQKLHKKTKQICNECNAEFKDDTCFKQHQNKHANIFPHTCKTCNKTFNSSSSLKKHEIIIHQPSSAKTFPCEICGKTFLYKSAFKVHLNTHDSSKIPYECEECNKSFTNQKSFGRHLETHKKNIKFECSICKTTSLRKDNIVRHIRNVHDHKDYEQYYKIVPQNEQNDAQECRSYENSSVIRSIGNVVPVVIPKETVVQDNESKQEEEQQMIAKTLKKKYNKNYDLYRQILMGGSDEDVSTSGKDGKASTSNFSATHWRKKFKENHISEGGA